VSCLCPGPTVSGFHRRAGTDRLRMSRGGMMSAERAAQFGYRAFQANKRVEIAGFVNTLMAAFIPFAPRAMVLRVARALMSP
jgi:short-subunit dehydrogenase